MPTTQIPYPIIFQFLCSVKNVTGMPAVPLDAEDGGSKTEALMGGGHSGPKMSSKGVVLGPDGKPCRTCTSVRDWASMSRSIKGAKITTNKATTATPITLPADCPPDVELLGRSSWTLLHSIAATYPEKPSTQQQQDATTFISSFSRLYPCHWCATDFQSWMKGAGGAPKVSSRQEFGQWLCEAQNEVNKKLGKEEFDCRKWEERWRTGWKDGRCD
ncbi:hypothetical protein EJ08DRAFT_645194 [Tothia fuscella]|uniref:Sulfhydryl oxidase n=1 Tax=Tothia fuscella TaxID=1048955 RepID=A0A9P4P2M6_9PEZI|nr:hypothetical protein EJ08DRAFT_645194 [Tothia fuscella]